MPKSVQAKPFIRAFQDIRMADIGEVGGKNASLGELSHAFPRKAEPVPPGFAITANAYWAFMDSNQLRAPVSDILRRYHQRTISLAQAGRSVRRLIMHAKFPQDLRAAILKAYADLRRRTGLTAVAVRSSATAEDLPHASFAGQHESFLNVRGEESLLSACRRCLASLFNDRAIAYRERNGFPDMKVALSIGVQTMVRSDKGAAGVMFTLDPESGFPNVIRIEGAWGLGEMVVKGTVTPDSYMVFKPLLSRVRFRPIVEKSLGQAREKMVYGRSAAGGTRVTPTSSAERSTFVLNDDEVLTLARWADAIEKHYRKPMDIEWAKDGRTNCLYIVQARPVTVHAGGDEAQEEFKILDRGKLLATGLAVGNSIAVGQVHRVRDPKDVSRFPKGAILVARHTDPDWVPLMRQASAVITEQGGRTSHAAIVSREFGLPAVIGAPSAKSLKTGETVTVSTCEGDEGKVYAGAARYTARKHNLAHAKPTRTEIMVNLANPAAAMRWWRMPAAGIGLARMEFIIANHIKIHPLALARFTKLKDRSAQRQITALTRGEDKKEYFIDRLARGIGRLAALCYPRPVIVRTSDFKTNEYAALLGGRQFEPVEENPMIGWRGASRYYSPDYADGFALECAAIARAREDLGFDNVVVMIPFCRTPEEADKVLKEMAKNGLKRGRNGLQVYVMCEIPSNVILAESFAQRFDGFSIGSNDLTQLTLGCDRDSRTLAPLFREDNAAVQWSIRHVIKAAHASRRKVGFCGQAPSDNPGYAAFLVEAGIDSISVTPDSFGAVKASVAKAEAKRRRR
ncbi:MAG: phosphoenolpyruvate synthase [Rhodospirillaceae bacterium]